MTFWPSVSAAMGIGGGSRQCCRKCHPIWALQLQKKVFMSGLYLHNLDHRLFLKD